MASEDGDVQIVLDSQFVLLCEYESTDHSTRVFICPIVMALAFPGFKKTFQKFMMTNSYDEEIEQGNPYSRLLPSRLLPYPSEFVGLRAKLQSSPRCAEELNLMRVTTSRPAVWVDLCWAMHGELHRREDLSQTMMSATLDLVESLEISERAKYTVCREIRWALGSAVKASLDVPYDDAKLKSLLYIASRLHENGADLGLLSSAIRPILKLVPSTVSRASLLSQQLLEDDLDYVLDHYADKLSNTLFGLKEKVKSETKTTSVCPNGCSYVSNRGPLFVRHLFELRLLPVYELVRQSAREVRSKLEKSSLEHLSHLKACSGRKGIDCKGMQMVSTSKLVKEVRSLAKHLDDGCDMSCLACLCGVEITGHRCWNEEGKEIEL
ncbi:hypothetical protein CKM354_000909600 [Cercospora kikuchii]|uniref:Uncharacterized protein n=1 Tax=Cercospora kikuchii TaxID=84275 RepID=A0A9P3CSP2_9PEZI|nr:uncharacterized protein CKM354_000909600 [Cercospora kikuchii]GIZ45950.1 hypothetical protein CKM354_000909600 [Cercospora kikuchii]